MSHEIVFYHSPYTRSYYTLWLLEELGVPYTRVDANIFEGRNKDTGFLTLNPLGKVPTLVIDGQVMTEAAFICVWLADAFAQKGLAPALDDPRRVRYLRAFGLADCVADLISDRMGHARTNAVAGMTSYGGDVDTFYKVLREVISPGPFVLGEQFSAADVMLMSVLGWGQMMHLLPADTVVDAYAARADDRPAHARANAIDAEMMPEPPSFGG